MENSFPAGSGSMDVNNTLNLTGISDQVREGGGYAEDLNVSNSSSKGKVGDTSVAKVSGYPLKRPGKAKWTPEEVRSAFQKCFALAFDG